VRREVAFVIVSVNVSVNEETCCSINSSLPAHVFLVTGRGEAAGTMEPGRLTLLEP